MAKRESIWNAPMVGMIMKCMSEIEEEGLSDEEYVPEDVVANIANMQVDEARRSVVVGCLQGTKGVPGETPYALFKALKVADPCRKGLGLACDQLQFLRRNPGLLASRLRYERRTRYCQWSIVFESSDGMSYPPSRGDHGAQGVQHDLIIKAPHMRGSTIPIAHSDLSHEDLSRRETLPEGRYREASIPSDQMV
ncbi:hypothetical protein BP5796_12805 [Coleophoma crateriformis]|uniref:Uncharacterized protein n=1 Tax=Coleophoma crateriformis TaxID=565419 RepID=A0A3D8Q672_9HELO|nr:hypothetical protein BP5796_12805 [Coleophoma crateriformis]